MSRDEQPAAAMPDDAVPLVGGDAAPSVARRWWQRRTASRRVGLDAADATRPVEPVPLASNDPLLAYVTAQGAPVDLREIQLDSTGVRALREAGVRMLVPLVVQGELVGLLQLGDRLSEQDYSTDDRRLLESIATQAGPAMRLGQVVAEQADQVRVRERYEQELRVAQLIQQRFLPTDLPEPDGWHIAAFYRAAREVGGDFYDFIDLPDGRLGIVLGDVTDKGVPAALVMASTRSVLRAAAQRLVEPGPVLARVNDELAKDMPPKMFVTCFYGVLDPPTGRMVFANAGHDLPYLDTCGTITELRATGMPLGLMSGMVYDEHDIDIPSGGRVLVYSDGIAEAHAPDGAMFGFPRLQREFAEVPDDMAVVDGILDAVARFTGPGWEQEDDITMVTLDRVDRVGAGARVLTRHLAGFDSPSRPGGERVVIERVAEVVLPLGLSDARREALLTAVGEATMNAMEHGNDYAADRPVEVEVVASEHEVSVAITDLGGRVPDPARVDDPDIDAKLRGEQTPRGWGLFLVRELVDDLHEHADGLRHTVTLVMSIEERR